jgi:DNA-binding NarL/FixJ family response regulator
MENFSTQSCIDNSAHALAKRLGARPSEAKVGLLLMQGFCNKEIARKLSISESTVKTHVSSLLRLSSLHNRVQLTNLLFELSPGLDRNRQSFLNSVQLLTSA